LEQNKLLSQPVLALAQRGDLPSHRRDTLADGQVKVLHKGSVDLLTTCTRSRRKIFRAIGPKYPADEIPFASDKSKYH
jgi:hypothetical protein